MPTKRRRDHEDADKLRKLGFEFQAPVDEYSYQPDSSGTIGGTRGKQEYGISGGASEEDSGPDSDRRTDGLLDGRGMNTLDAEEVGISEFSGHASAGDEDELEDSKKPSYMFHVEASELEALIRDRLERHDTIDARTVDVTVGDRGSVTISGSVASEALKLRVEELVSALPGVSSIDNALSVATHH